MSSISTFPSLRSEPIPVTYSVRKMLSLFRAPNSNVPFSIYSSPLFTLRSSARRTFLQVYFADRRPFLCCNRRRTRELSWWPPTHSLRLPHTVAAGNQILRLRTWVSCSFVCFGEFRPCVEHVEFDLEIDNQALRWCSSHLVGWAEQAVGLQDLPPLRSGDSECYCRCSVTHVSGRGSSSGIAGPPGVSCIVWGHWESPASQSGSLSLNRPSIVRRQYSGSLRVQRNPSLQRPLWRLPKDCRPSTSYSRTLRPLFMFHPLGGGGAFRQS
jgi:hypothetical protein